MRFKVVICCFLSSYTTLIVHNYFQATDNISRALKAGPDSIVDSPYNNSPASIEGSRMDMCDRYANWKNLSQSKIDGMETTCFPQGQKEP